MDAALIDGSLRALTVVVEEKDDGVIDLSVGFERIEEGTEGVIEPEDVSGIVIDGEAA